MAYLGTLLPDPFSVGMCTAHSSLAQCPSPLGPPWGPIYPALVMLLCCLVFFFLTLLTEKLLFFMVLMVDRPSAASRGRLVSSESLSSLRPCVWVLCVLCVGVD